MSAFRLKTSTTSAYSQKIREVPSASPAAKPAHGRPVSRPTAAERTTQVPIVQSISFGYDDVQEWQEVALGRRPGHIYSRNTNPTVGAWHAVQTPDPSGCSARRFQPTFCRPCQSLPS